MASKYSYGLAKLELGDFSATDGAASNFVEIPVYKDTMIITETAPTATEHFQAGKVHPVFRALQGGGEMASFNVIDTNADLLVKFCGGTVTTVGQVKTWKKQSGQPVEKIAVLRATTLDGRIYTISRASVMANKNFDLSESKLTVIEVKATATETGFTGVAPITISESV